MNVPDKFVNKLLVYLSKVGFIDPLQFYCLERFILSKYTELLVSVSNIKCRVE